MPNDEYLMKDIDEVLQHYADHEHLYPEKEFMQVLRRCKARIEELETTPSLTRNDIVAKEFIERVERNLKCEFTQMGEREWLHVFTDFKNKLKDPS